jgi:hypothetical protein
MADQRFHSCIVGGRVLADRDPRPGTPLAHLGRDDLAFVPRLVTSSIASSFHDGLPSS